MKFSQRIGSKPVKKSIQLNDIDDDLRNGLWNNVVLHILVYFEDYSHKTAAFYFGLKIWKDFYKKPIDTVPEQGYYIKSIIKEKFYKADWTEVYDFVEFLAQMKENASNEIFVRENNKTLEEESSAYRFSKRELVPISNELELAEIEQAIGQGEKYTSLKGTNIHFSNSLTKLSDRENPDYRNSIKESISAVETTCRILTNQSTLGKALISLEGKGITINTQLKNAFEQMYAYTNNKESGIRHAIIDEFKEPDFDDAKYMLVSCSAFINYIIGKCIKLGINIE